VKVYVFVVVQGGFHCDVCSIFRFLYIMPIACVLYLLWLIASYLIACVLSLHLAWLP